jgi:hypothetical protein
MKDWTTYALSACWLMIGLILLFVVMAYLSTPPVAPQDATPYVPQVPTVWFTNEHVRLQNVLRTCTGTLYYQPYLTTQPLQCFDTVTFEDLKQDLTVVCIPPAQREVLGVPDCHGRAGGTP